MDPIIAETIGPVIGLIAVGTCVLIGMKMRYEYRVKQLEKGAGREATEQIETQLDQLRDQVLALREDVSELYERVEFTERMLARGKGDRAIGGGAAE